ncbi:MAG: phosphatase PAP2 family protein [Anaerolineae bacterium]
MNTLLLLALNGLAAGSTPLSAAVRFLVNDYVVPTALTLLLVVLWFSGRTLGERERRQVAAIQAAAAVVLANVIVKAANLLFFRPRPFAEHDVHLLFYRPTDSTLPSNPAAVAFAFAAAVAVHEPRWGLAMAVLAVLFGAARVMAGVHYPLDIVTGALVGGAAAAIALRLPGLRWLAYRLITFARRLLLA